MRAVTRYLLLPLALLVIALLSAGCGLQPTLSAVRMEPLLITPNADGLDDVTHIYYRIGRTSDVSISFSDSAGQTHYFRRAQRRSPGKYDVYWGGVINDTQVREVPGGRAWLTSRVLPDGLYTWVIEAQDVVSGAIQRAEGQVTLKDADNSLPELHNFTVVPQEFRPNQDGLADDRVSISYYLTKKAERLQVYLVRPGAQPPVKYPVAEQPSASRAEPGYPGYHGYRWDGGVDLNAEPPPNGDYVVYVEAEDKVGNRVVVSSTLKIAEGGKPRADIAGGEIDWQGEMNREVSVALNASTCFTATIINIGPVPIRTSGPWPGQLYKFSENFNTLAQRYKEESWGQQAGVWRFGIHYDTSGSDFPYRWAIGRKEDLEERIIDGVSQYYLLPGHRSQVSGCLQFDGVPPVGTQFWKGGLIHEQVAIANDDVDRISITVGAP